MKTVDRTMSVQQQVTDEGTGPGKSHNGGSESRLNLTRPDRRRGERRATRPGQRTKCPEASSKAAKVNHISSRQPVQQSKLKV